MSEEVGQSKGRRVDRAGRGGLSSLQGFQKNLEKSKDGCKHVNDFFHLEQSEA